MNRRYIVAKAPSNIAVVKYMGKQTEGVNLPMNASLSMTLNRFCSVAELSGLEFGKGKAEGGSGWRPELPLHAASQNNMPWISAKLGESGAARVDAFIARLSRELPPVLAKWGIEVRFPSGFELRTANTFPAASGLASSASAFAAITMAFAAAFSADEEAFRSRLSDTSFRQSLAQISRKGSGSSCRSFLGPWVYWEGEEIEPVESSLPACVDLVCLVKGSPKSVSSSEAHRRVTSSPVWEGRPERANRRVVELKKALLAGDWEKASTISWHDMWDMHQLFHTSAPPFSYWEASTFEILKWLMTPEMQENEALGKAMITLDAGPNVHLLVPRENALIWKEQIHRRFPEMTLLED